MTREIIALGLEAEGLKSGAAGYVVSDEKEVTCFVGTPGDTLTISRIVKLDLKDKFVALTTVKEERFFFAYEDVLGFRFSGAAQAKERAAGFSR